MMHLQKTTFENAVTYWAIAPFVAMFSTLFSNYVSNFTEFQYFGSDIFKVVCCLSVVCWKWYIPCSKVWLRLGYKLQYISGLILIQNTSRLCTAIIRLTWANVVHDFSINCMIFHEDFCMQLDTNLFVRRLPIMEVNKVGSFLLNIYLHIEVES